MRAKCPKCGIVYETPYTPGLVHIGSIKLLKCPACGKRSMMPTGVKDPVTWPKEERDEEATSKQSSEEDTLDRRIRDSKYE